MIDREGPHTPGEAGDGIQRDKLAAGRADIKHGQSRRVELVLRLELHDHLIFVIRSQDGGDLPGSVGSVESIFHLLRGHVQGRSLVPVDFDIYLRVRNLEVAGHVLKPR